MSADYPAKLYVAVHDGNPGDVEFYRARCEGAHSILELGCGDARVLAALAEEGRSLVGVDVDDELLGLARARRESLGPLAATLEFVTRDMAVLELGRRFDRVIIPYGGLYCLLDDAAITALFEVAARHLVPGGQLIFDCWAADGFHEEADPEDLAEGWIERVKSVEVDGEIYEVLERSAWDSARQRIDVTYIHVPVGGDPESAVEGLLRQRYLLGAQVLDRAGCAGFAPVELLGDFEGGSYGPESALMIAVCELRVPG